MGSGKTGFELVFIFLVLSLMAVISCNNGNDQLVNPAVEEKVQDLLLKMTLEEKVGQMTQVDRQYLKSTEDIRDFFLGSLLSGGGSTPATNTPKAWADMYDEFQRMALQTRLRIPLIYGIDAVHGHNNVNGAVIFPHNIGMGASRNPELYKKACEITALEVAGTGIDWTFGPCLAVPQNERWGRTYEGFAETADVTQAMAAAAVQGFQGDDLSDGKTILACAKHFIGDGGTTDGIDRGNTVADEETLRSLHLPGFISAIQSGVGSIMVSYSSWNGVKCHGNKYLLTDLLKEELGFQGFVVSDWAGINELPGDYKSQIEAGILAGIDMVMVPDNYQDFITNLISLVEEGRIPISRIDDAVTRILRIKFHLGLFEHPYTDRSLLSEIGSDQHREIARECVRSSLVLLKNENNLLPLSKNLSRIHVAGRGADNIGMQCGGWTITWQGSMGDITPGTTILEAIQSSVSENTTVTYSEDGSEADGADVAVAVIGEEPYAEMHGDREDLSLSQEDLTTLQNLKNTDVPLVVILLSGRPMIITEQIQDWDALIAAWLPGTEGQGVTDVLFGDYNPTGKLTHSWPKSMAQIPINVNDSNYDPLFEYGFGLSY